MLLACAHHKLVELPPTAVTLGEGNCKQMLAAPGVVSAAVVLPVATAEVALQAATVDVAW